MNLLNLRYLFLIYRMRAKPKPAPAENSIVGPGKYDNTTKYKKKGGMYKLYKIYITSIYF